MRSPLVIPSPGKSTLPVLVSATVSLPTLTCSRVVVLATLRNLPDHVGRALVPAESLEPWVAQLPGRGLLVEPGPHLARIDELPVAVVDAQQQRAEPDPAASRVGVPADHELLAILALELQPVLGPAGLVRGIGPLGDEPFPARLAGFGVEPDA